jgi:hypothetical protein
MRRLRRIYAKLRCCRKGRANMCHVLLIIRGEKVWITNARLEPTTQLWRVWPLLTNMTHSCKVALLPKRQRIYVLCITYNIRRESMGSKCPARVYDAVMTSVAALVQYDVWMQSRVVWCVNAKSCCCRKGIANMSPVLLVMTYVASGLSSDNMCGLWPL